MTVSYWQQAYISYIECLQKLLYKDNIFEVETKTVQNFTLQSKGLFLCGPEQNCRERGPNVVRPQSGKDSWRYCSSDVVD